MYYVYRSRYIYIDHLNLDAYKGWDSVLHTRITLLHDMQTSTLSNGPSISKICINKYIICVNTKYTGDYTLINTGLLP